MQEQNNASRMAITNDVRDYVFFIVCVLLSIFFARTTYFIFHIDENTSLFLLFFLLAGFAYTLSKKRTLSNNSLLQFAFLFTLTLIRFLYPEQYLLKFFSFYMIVILFLYWIQGACEHHVLQKESTWIVLDIVQALKYPLIHMPLTLRFITSLIPGNHRQSFLKVLIGFIVGLPLLFVLSTILSSADSNFALLLSRFPTTSLTNDDWLTWIVTLLRALPVMLYCFSAWYGHLHQAPQPFEEEVTRVKLQRFAFVPSTIYHTIELMLSILYIMFLYASLQSILAILSSNRYQFSYSQFAREGFFQLCVVACINLILYLLFHLTCKERTKLGLMLERILCIETLGLILTAMCKLCLYILAYDSFTILRLYATWFLIVLFGIFLALYIGNKSQKNMIVNILYYCCICFLVLTLINTDSLSPQQVVQ